MVAEIIGGYIAFAVVFVIILVFSIFFTRYYQDKHDNERLPTITTIIGLTLVLGTVTLVPVDIFIFASTNNPTTGEKYDWATQDFIDYQTNVVTILYYVLYSIMMVYSFLIIPFAYFYFEEYDDNISTKQRVFGALKYTSFLIVIFVVLLILGLFLKPGTAQPTDPQWYIDLLDSDSLVRGIIFMVAILALLGWLVFIGYTAYGLVAWPVDLIRGHFVKTQTEEIEVSDDLASTREKTRALKQKYLSGKKMNKNDESDLQRLERKGRLLERRSNLIEATNKTWWTTLVNCLRPFEIVFGIFFLLITTLIFVSLLLSGIDKAVYSLCGAGCGFIIDTPVIFNPMNSLLLYASQYFPLDYVILVSIIAYFFFATMAGIIKIGVRFLWVHMYRIRAQATAPQGLLLTCLMLMLSLICLNIVATTLAPQYTSYGFQLYCPNSVNSTSTACVDDPSLLQFCDITAPANLCTPSVVSTIVNKITANQPFFGVAFFIGNWLFLAACLVGLIFAIFRRRNTAIRLVDSDDEA